MKILKLEKTKIGVLVTYKTLFKTRKRVAIRCYITPYWLWADTGNFIVDDSVIHWFEKSKLDTYVLNGNHKTEKV